MEKEIDPEESITLPEVVIGTHYGDWHEALVAYQKWVKSWYKPDCFTEKVVHGDIQFSSTIHAF